MARAYTNQSQTAFDAHCHLDHIPAGDRRAAVERARSQGVDSWMLSGADPCAWTQLRAISSIPGCFYQLGLHPWWAQDMNDETQDHWIRKLYDTDHPHGLGESGLDKRRAKTSVQREQQLRALRAHVELATQQGLPLVLHGAHSWGSVMAELPPSAEAMLHSFSGSPELASQAVRKGFYLSFGPSVLVSKRARAAAVVVPDSQLLIETDSPDQSAPVALLEVAKALAELRQVPLDHILATTRHNACNLFRIPESPHES